MSQMSSLWNRVWYEKANHPLSIVLMPLSWFFRVIARVRRKAYSNGFLHKNKLSVPVIVVGNISVGGTGKTPLVVWLVQYLKRKGYKPGVISRGYGGESHEQPQKVTIESDPALVGDEPVVIARNSLCPVYVSPQRFEAGKRLLEDDDCDILISDDGLQHYSLYRDFEICVIDGQRRHGNSRCLPSGPLREPISRLKTVDAIVCNGEDFAGEFFMRLQAERFNQVAGEDIKALSEFKGKKVHAIAGIGNPSRFFDTLRSLGVIVIEHAYDDHYYYNESELDFADKLPVIMTEKDAVKCAGFSNPNLWYLSIEAVLPEIFETRLNNMLKDIH